MDKYIKQLLQLHSKVILPQFGAIVLSNEETGTLMFNEYLTYDDGKIVELIGNEENIDQEKAKSKVEKLVQEIQSKLESGASYSLGDLGVFSKNDDKISFKGNLKTGNNSPSSSKKDTEKKNKGSKENVYVEKKGDNPASQDKAKDEKVNTSDQLKKDKIENKKAKKEKNLKDKEEKKRKRLEDKNKKKAEKERLKKERAENKKSQSVGADKIKEDKSSSKSKPTTDKNASIGSSSTDAKIEDLKVKDKKDLEDRKKAEKDKKGGSSIKTGTAATTVKNKKKKPDKTKKEERKKGPLFWVLIVLIILLLIGGIWMALNYEKVETYMGWNKFETVDASNNEQSTEKEENGSIPIIDSLEASEESDSLDQNNSNDATDESRDSNQEEADQSDSQTNQPVASSTGDYHIIVGGFQKVSNAKNMVQSLKDQGFNGEMLDGLFTGLELHFVSAQNYSSFDDAEADLQRIKQAVNNGAWIFKN